ncbi:MAG TPA: DinB family protein [Balneolaceae bacterium]|nr:DinB family protein [Balneolaceae bacterium]
MKNVSLESIFEVLDPPRGFSPWHGGPTLMGALRGVDALQAAWKPAPDRHSIWELALHIAYWNYSVRRHFDPAVPKGFTRSPSNFPQNPDTSDKAWKEDLSLITEEHNKLVLTLKAFPENRLNEKINNSEKWTYAQLLTGIVVHDSYHIAQIQLMKRLYASLDKAKKI